MLCVHFATQCTWVVGLVTVYPTLLIIAALWWGKIFNPGTESHATALSPYPLDPSCTPQNLKKACLADAACACCPFREVPRRTAEEPGLVALFGGSGGLTNQVCEARADMASSS
jgi:hypothetical protein